MSMEQRVVESVRQIKNPVTEAKGHMFDVEPEDAQFLDDFYAAVWWEDEGAPKTWKDLIIYWGGSVPHQDFDSFQSLAHSKGSEEIDDATWVEVLQKLVALGWGVYNSDTRTIFWKPGTGDEFSKYDYIESRKNKKQEDTDKSMMVTVGAVPNPDFTSREPVATVNIPTKKVAVSDYAAASQTCQTFIQQNRLGSGNWGGSNGIIYVGDVPVAKVTYNGKVFDNDRNLLYNPYDSGSKIS